MALGSEQEASIHRPNLDSFGARCGEECVFVLDSPLGSYLFLPGEGWMYRSHSNPDERCFMGRTLQVVSHPLPADARPWGEVRVEERHLRDEGGSE